MFAVSPLRSFKKIKKGKKTQPLWPTAAAWVVACRLPWETAVGLTAVGHDGWTLDSNRRDPQQPPCATAFGDKTDKFRNGRIILQNE
jgi:hypothetical protein